MSICLISHQNSHLLAPSNKMILLKNEYKSKDDANLNLDENFESKKRKNEVELTKDHVCI